MVNKWLRIWRFNHPLRYRYRGFIERIWIKKKYRRVRINLNYDEYAWLIADLKDLKVTKGFLRCDRFYKKLVKNNGSS